MSKRKTADPVVLPITGEDDDFIVASLPNDDLPWITKVRNSATNFFDALTEIPEAGWEKCTIYLYRLEPAISNKSGDRAYIGVYASPLTEESVRKAHGGGKYQLYLKYGRQTLRNHRFAVDGAPILQDGQTPRGAGAVAGTVITGENTPQNFAGIVAEVIRATKGDPAAANAGIEVMRKAMTDGLEIQKDMMKQQMGSATGSTLGDKLFESIVIPLLTKPAGMDPLLSKFIEASISNMKADRRENPNNAPAAAAPSGELALVKELLGVDNLREVIDLGRGAGKGQPWWATLIVNAVDKLPALLGEYAQMQERGFQRALIAHREAGASAGRLPGPGAFPMPDPAPLPREEQVRYGATAAPRNGGGDVAAMSLQMVQGVITAICDAYDAGYDGAVAAAHIRLSYPDLVEVLRPMLGDTRQLGEFVSQDPNLADRARDADWLEFQEEFIEELSGDRDAGAVSVSGPIPVPESSISVGAS